MLPGGTIAAAFILALIPGWLFLRFTDRSRQPRAQSSLQELLEVVAVGLATSGAALLFWGWARPDAIFSLMRQPDSANELQVSLWSATTVLAMAPGLSLLAAWLARRLRPESYSLGVWWEVLTKEHIPAGHTAHIAIDLGDGLAVDGVLHAYTWSDDAAHRDISLEAPIRFTRASGEIATSFDRVVIPGDEIKHLSLQYVPQAPERYPEALPATPSRDKLTK
jgi:hypothetical protein